MRPNKQQMFRSSKKFFSNSFIVLFHFLGKKKGGGGPEEPEVDYTNNKNNKITHTHTHTIYLNTIHLTEKSLHSELKGFIFCTVIFFENNSFLVECPHFSSKYLDTTLTKFLWKPVSSSVLLVIISPVLAVATGTQDSRSLLSLTSLLLVSPITAAPSVTLLPGGPQSMTHTAALRPAFVTWAVVADNNFKARWFIWPSSPAAKLSS